MIEPFRIIWANARLLAHAVYSDVVQKHKGSVLGAFWIVLQPMLLLIMYSIVYLLVLKIGPKGMTPAQYIVHIFSGLVPFLAFSEAIGGGLGSVESNKSLLKNTVFPAALLPVKAVLGVLPSFAVSMLVVLLASIFVNGIHFWYLLVPILMLAQLLFVCGISWMLSLISIVLRDTKNVISFVLTLMMIGAPIAYDRTILDGTLQLLIWLNPAAYFVVGFQESMAGQGMQLAVLLPTCIISFVTFIAGFLFFKRLSPVVANYVG